MPTIYRVIGSMSVRGNAAHPKEVQTVIFSFDLGYTLPGSGQLPTVVGAPDVFSFGPLGDDFKLKVISNQGYIGFFSSLGELDLMVAQLVAPGPPVATNQCWLYSCTVVPTGPCAFFYNNGQDIYGTACAAVYEREVIQIPPPHPDVRGIAGR